MFRAHPALLALAAANVLLACGPSASDNQLATEIEALGVSGCVLKTTLFSNGTFDVDLTESEGLSGYEVAESFLRFTQGKTEAGYDLAETLGLPGTIDDFNLNALTTPAGIEYGTSYDLIMVIELTPLWQRS